MARTIVAKVVVGLGAMASAMISLVSVMCDRRLPDMLRENTGWNLRSIRGILHLGTTVSRT